MPDQRASDWDIAGGSIAENYERYLVPTIFAPMAVDLLDVVEPGAGDHILDVACGTGIVARLAAERVGPTGGVVGLDFLPDMLDYARSQPTTDPPVEWEHASADDMPFPDEAFTIVLCQHGLQFFPDKPTALGEMHRVMAPGGKLGLTVLRDISRAPGLMALAEALTRNIGPAPAAFVRMVGSLDDEAELRGLVEGAGLHEVAVETVTKDLHFPSPNDFVRQYLLSTPLAASPLVSHADEAVRVNVETDVRSQLMPYTGDDGLVFPAETYVVTARK